ncbi:hypothetical protein ACHWQZ_G017412 [Mnemiopsis leidyi]
MSATISPFLNVPVGHSEIKRRFTEEEPQTRKRQKLDPPTSTANSQVDEWVNRNIDDLPKILESNSPVKKPWSDVDQAKAIDSIKRALVQITTSYKKENQEPTPVSCSEVIDSSSTIKSRGILTTQQPRYDNLGAAPASHTTLSQSLPPHSQGPVMKDVFYGGQENVENTGQYTTCYTTYQSVPAEHPGVYKSEKQTPQQQGGPLPGQYHYFPEVSPSRPEQPYPSPPRTDTDMMYSSLNYSPLVPGWPQPAGPVRQHYTSPQQGLNWNDHAPVTDCMSPTNQVYVSTPSSPDVPLTPPDEADSKPKTLNSLSDYSLQNLNDLNKEMSDMSSAHGPGKVCHPMEVFCTVPGRLSLLSGASKYNVTIGEVQRRLTYPESLNVSLLGGVLRRAKAKNGNHALRSQLEERNITIPTGRRKAASVSLFTSLLEGESAQLANDFNTLCEKFFPCRELAKAAVINDSHRYHIPQEQHLQRVMNTKQMITDLQELMEMNVVKNNEIMNTQGVGGHHNVPCPQLMTFELLTHGFGASALSAALNVVQTYLDEMVKCMTLQ